MGWRSRFVAEWTDGTGGIACLTGERSSPGENRQHLIVEPMAPVEPMDPGLDPGIPKAGFVMSNDRVGHQPVPGSGDEVHLDLPEALAEHRRRDVGGNFACPEDHGRGSRLPEGGPAADRRNPLGEPEHAEPRNGVELRQELGRDAVEVRHLVLDFREPVFAGHPRRADAGPRLSRVRRTGVETAQRLGGGDEPAGVLDPPEPGEEVARELAVAVADDPEVGNLRARSSEREVTRGARGPKAVLLHPSALPGERQAVAHREQAQVDPLITEQ